jgi:membrane-associated phospholipid phosphatase
MVRAEARSPAFLTAAVVGGIAAPLALFSALAVQASTVEASGSEQEFVDWFYRRTLRLHEGIDLFLAAGRVGGLLLFGVLAIGLMARARVRESLFLIAALAGATAVAAGAKLVVNELSTKPEGTALDFPSGHAAVSLAAVGATLALVEDRVSSLVAILAVGLVFAYGAALVARNWHCPSEVLAGWCVGLAWLSVVRLAAAFLGSTDLGSAATAPKGA